MNRENDTITRAFKGILAVQIMSMLVGIAGCVIDGMIIGRFLGEEAMAAFGLASSVTLIPAVAATILGTGASVVCSKSLGKGSLEQTRARFSACFSATAVICALLAVLIVSLAEPAARLVGARDSLSPMAADYIRGYGFACPGIILVALLMPLMQMDGEMKRLLAAVVAMTVGDVAADLMNVLVFHGGMLGMALATAFSYALALGILLPHLWKKGAIFSRPAFTPDRDTTVHMIAAGFPTATNQLGRLFLTFVLNRYLLSLGGGIAVAAHAVIMSGSATADEFMETLSAPALRTSLMSWTFLIPPPTASGTVRFFAVSETTSSMVCLASSDAEMSRKVISSAPCLSYSTASSEGFPTSLRPLKLMPLTTLPFFMSRQGIILFANIAARLRTSRNPLC